MSDFFANHLDFVYLVDGLAFFILALTAGSMARRRGTGADWRYLSVFGVFHGLSEWAEMVSPMLGAQTWFSLFRGAILAASFLCLFEFGRRSLVWHWNERIKLWIYLPWLLVILIGVQFVPGDYEALIRLNLGLPAGILATCALMQSGLLHSDEQRWITYVCGGLAFGLFFICSGLMVPAAHFWPASFLNEKWFWTHVGIPIQILRGLLAGLVALVFWLDSLQWRVQHFPADFVRRVKYVHWFSFIGLVLVVVSGWILVERADLRCREDHTWRLQSLARGMASVINPQEVLALSGTKADLKSQSYFNLKLQCQKISEADPCIRYVYLMVVREKKVVFLVDVEPDRFKKKIDEPNAVPGDIYEKPPPEILTVAQSGGSLISKPYSDAWGYFISGYSSIQDATGNIVAILGIDSQGEQWLADIANARLLRLLVTAGGIVLVLFFSLLWRREMEEGQLRNMNGQRMQIQQSALLHIANSAAVAEGNIFMMARAVTVATADVLGVDKVELWLKLKEDGRFRAEDIYQAGVGSHTSGQFSRVRAGDPFLNQLNEGRVTASSNVNTDERFVSIREELGKDVCGALISPLRVSGALSGWLIATQSKKGRCWLTDEMRFIAEMTDQVLHCLINNERRRAEDAQQKAHDELERRVHERTEALSRKNEELSREISERQRIEKEQRILQEKMQQAQKLESLGLMAGGIAHDFNNILMAVLGNVELAKLETPESSPVYEYLKDIDKASCRAAELARQMLIYSGRGHASIQGIDLNEMVNDMTSILKVSLGKKIQLAYELEPDLPLVDGDLTQMRQVLMNLVINASEAIGQDNGTITLKTGVIQYDKAMFMAMWMKEELPEGKYVFMDVMDNGSGMEKSTLERIFDPFFSTKFTGRGLGLAAVLGIVKGHNGAIDVFSEVGQGTRFRIILPIGHQDNDQARPVQGGADLEWKGAGTILLVDDEVTIRVLGRRMLERLGFSVLVATNGNEAIELFRQHSSRISCVLLDLTMPDLNGREVFEEIRRLDPGVKVILCSGFMEDNMAGNFPDGKVSGFLQKPYKLEALTSVLRNMLNG